MATPSRLRRRLITITLLVIGSKVHRCDGFGSPTRTSAKYPPLLNCRHRNSLTQTRKSAATVPTDPINSEKDDGIYDAITIGSGMSGLVAGNYLVREGRKVLIVESHSIPGGYTTNFYRKGYRFEVSTHVLNGCDPTGTVGRILKEFGADHAVDFIPLKSLLRWIDPARNIDCVLPIGIAEYVDTLSRLFPDQADGIRAFHDRYYPVAEFVVEYEKKRGLNQILFVLQSLPVLFRLLSLRRKTAADILDRHITDPACREVMTVMTGLFGLHYTELDAAVFVMGSMMFHAGGAYYPRGGSGKLSGVLAKTFTDHEAGHMLLKTHCDEILFEDGVATGIKIKDQKGRAKLLKARCVINCSDMTTLVNKLCPPGILPDHFVKSVHKRVPGNSLVLAWAGLDIDLREKGIQDFEIIRSNNKSNQTKVMLDKIMATADYSELPFSGTTIYSNIDPSCCPPGKSVISTNFMASYDVFARTLGPDSDRSSKEYHSLKDRVGKQLLDCIVKATKMPDLLDHVKVMEVATPVTFQRYTDNLGGSFMGWRLTPNQGAFSAFSPKTPVRNLFACGQWLGVGGVSSVMTTGLEAAKLAERHLRVIDNEKARCSTGGSLEKSGGELSQVRTSGAAGN